jgi:hypothetical protein
MPAGAEGAVAAHEGTRRAIADGRVHHDGNPVTDVDDRQRDGARRRERKRAAAQRSGREENKIDGAVAVIMGRRAA